MNDTQPVGSSSSSKGVYVKPALLTGTSSEFLGKRALPRLVNQRQCVFVMGPDGSGKSSVADRLARLDLSRRANPKCLDTRELQRVVVERVREGQWSDAWLKTKALVLDGPVWLHRRQGVIDVLVELIRARLDLGLRTVIVQSDADGSADALMARLEPGSYAVVGLRFPKGPRGRLRFARMMCDELGISRDAARGTQHLTPWRYGLVLAQLKEAGSRMR